MQQLQRPSSSRSSRLVFWAVAPLMMITGACTGSIAPSGGSAGPGAAGESPSSGGALPGSTSPASPSSPGTNGGPSSPTPGDPAAGVCQPAARRLWRLTPEQYRRTVEAMFPGQHAAGQGLARTLTVDAEGFSNDAGALSMTPPHVTEIVQSSFQLARDVTADPGALLPCLAGGAPDDACLRTLVTRYGGQAFRRDLAPAEIDRLLTFTRSGVQRDLREGLRQFFMYLLASPHFLYRTELGPESAGGTGAVALDGFEKASALSYFLTDGPPDEALLTAARAGQLEDRAALGAEARRLLATPQGAGGFSRMLRETFQSDSVAGEQKDPAVFKTWSDVVARDLAAETDAFMTHILWNEDGKLGTLLNAGYSLLNPGLAKFYGVDDPGGGAGFHKVAFPAGQRAGLLTQASRLAVGAEADDSNPVRRGLFIREVFLCQEVPAPPADLNVMVPAQDGQWRERLAVHAKDPRCAGCHAQMDALGLAFERYDGVGLYRDSHFNKPLDTTGTMTGAGADVPFKDGVELAALLARSPEVERCFAGHVFRYALGRKEEEADRCALNRLADQFRNSGGDVRTLATAIVTDDAFTQRR
jgi:hypothetical protein